MRDALHAMLDAVVSLLGGIQHNSDNEAGWVYVGVYIVSLSGFFGIALLVIGLWR